MYILGHLPHHSSWPSGYKFLRIESNFYPVYLTYIPSRSHAMSDNMDNTVRKVRRLPAVGATRKCGLKGCDRKVKVEEINCEVNYTVCKGCRDSDHRETELIIRSL